MDKNIFEEGPRRGHAAGDTSIEQQASQLASDIKYKARQKMKGKSGSNMSPSQVQQLYRSLLGSSTAPGGVKAIVKKKLFGEQIDPGIVPVSEHVKESSSYVFSRVFLEADEKKFVIKVTDRATGNTSYRKADRAKIAELRANKNISSVEITGRKEVDDAYKGDPKPNYGGKKAKKDYDGDGKVESGSKEHAGVVHNAIQRKKGGVADGKDTRKEEVEQIDEVIGSVAKVAALGARGATKAATLAAKGAVKAAPVVAKAAKGAVKGAVKGAKAVNKVGKKVGRLVDTADKAANVALKVKELEKRENANEEVMYEKKDDNNKKLDVMKGKNSVKINPTIGESIRAELDALKAIRIEEQESAMANQKDEKKKEALASKQAKKDKMMKLRILQNKMRAVRGGVEITASHEMQGDSIIEGEDNVRYCPACDKDETRDECKYGEEYWDENSKPAKDEDPRGNYAKINLGKNKLRAMGLKMSYDMEDELKRGAAELKNESAEDRLRDRRMERGGVDGNTRYNRPPAKKASNAIKPGKTAVQKKVEKKHGKGASAMDIVKAEIRAKHGKGAIMNTKRK